MADVLSIGGIEFTDYSPPERMPYGGQQAMIVHKLPGGTRVIDTLGPDESDITFRGFFFGNDALDRCDALDAMRAAGEVVPMIFAGKYRSVLIKEFIPRIARYPVWIEYEITCTVTANPSLGLLGNIQGAIDALIGGDLTSALALPFL